VGHPGYHLEAMVETIALAAALAAAPAPVTAVAPAAAAGTSVAPRASPFVSLEAGLELALLPGPPSASGDGLIAVVRVDPVRFDLKLMNASAPGEGRPRTVRDWAYRSGASAAINASLYQSDWSTATGLMRSRDHVNHARLSKDRAVLAFDPLVSGVAPVRIIDRDCEDVEVSGKAYAALVQSIRMVSCDRKGVWAPSDRRFSSAVVGVDGAGRLLLIHAATPWPVHELVAALLAAPIDLRQAMYVEGGPEAQLYVRGGGTEVVRYGTSERALDLGAMGLPVPNVIAVVRRPLVPAATGVSPETKGSRP
jgi:Phosphodiester glycosidase